MLVCQTRDQQYRRRQNQHQRARDKPGPPEPQLADDSGPASCARLRRVGYGPSNQLWRRKFGMHLLNSNRSRIGRLGPIGRIGHISILFLALSLTASAQRKRAEPLTNAIPSPRSVFGFNPGDDRTIVDWKQITDYF